MRYWTSCFSIINSYLNDEKFIESIKLGCAYSRVKIDENSILYGITKNTVFSLSNIYSLINWIPMRKSSNPLKWNRLNQKYKSPIMSSKSISQTKFLFE